MLDLYWFVSYFLIWPVLRLNLASLKVHTGLVLSRGCWVISWIWRINNSPWLLDTGVRTEGQGWLTIGQIDPKMDKSGTFKVGFSTFWLEHPIKICPIYIHPWVRRNSVQTEMSSENRTSTLSTVETMVYIWDNDCMQEIPDIRPHYRH